MVDKQFQYTPSGRLTHGFQHSHVVEIILLVVGVKYEEVDPVFSGWVMKGSVFLPVFLGVFNIPLNL